MFSTFSLILYYRFVLSDVHVILKINTYIMCSVFTCSCACHYCVVNLVK